VFTPTTINDDKRESWNSAHIVNCFKQGGHNLGEGEMLKPEAAADKNAA
jgi:hypothetical protein